MNDSVLLKWLSGLICCIFTVLLSIVVHAADESICARVRIQIDQELTLERQAFNAHMRINNGLSTIALEDVNVDVLFTNESGDSVLASSDPDSTDALFFISLDSMENINDVSGSGTVAPSTSADIHWLIIPAIGASNGLEQGALYYVGARLTYTVNGQQHVIEVSPDYIFVKPLPELALDYFLPEDVYGDDAFTPEIEAPIAFTLGVRIKNNGGGWASSVAIDSAQPKIVDNDQGLLVNFIILGSEVNGVATADSLLVDFGDIAPLASGTARWLMSCNLSGKFIDFQATVSHDNELGGELTSIVDSIDTHVLVHDVLVDLSGRDHIRDFLARDGTLLTVYESDSLETTVSDQSALAGLQLISSGSDSATYQLSLPAGSGFIYVELSDPRQGQQVIAEAVRSDGKIIDLNNVWLSKRRDDNLDWQYFLHIFDANPNGGYTIVFQDPGARPQPPVLQFIPNRNGVEGQQVSFIVEASDPNGTTPSIAASPLPPGATFVDQANGTAVFDWTPMVGQAGRYSIRYTASDGVFQTTQRAVLSICDIGDTDCDGMNDQWELDNFGSLDNNGQGDFDGDGISDLDEFLNGTNPRVAVLITLKTGYNMIAVTEDPARQITLGEWFMRLGGSEIVEKMEAFNPATGTFVNLVPGDTSNEDYTLVGGEGLIVYALREHSLFFADNVCVAIDLRTGINLVGLPCAPEDFSAFQLLEFIGSQNAVSIQRYDAEKGKFQTAGFTEAGQLSGDDFTIVPGEGYYLYMRNAVSAFELK